MSRIETRLKSFLPPPSQKIARDARKEYTAFTDRRYTDHQAEKEVRQEHKRLQGELNELVMAPKRSKEMEAQKKEEIAEVEERIAVLEAEKAERADPMTQPTPSAWPLVETSIDNDFDGMQQSFGVTDELLPGKDERGMVDHYRNSAAPLYERMNALTVAPQPLVEAIDAIRDTVIAAGNCDIPRMSRLVYDKHKNRWTQRRFKLPTFALTDGVGFAMRVPDAMALLCMIDPEGVTKKIAAIALADHDESQAIPIGDRIEQMNAVRAEILMNARKGEYWIRQCSKKGLAGGPRFTDDIRAILDLV